MKTAHEIVRYVAGALIAALIVSAAGLWIRVAAIEAQQAQEAHERERTREEMIALREELQDTRRLLERLLGRLDAGNWSSVPGQARVQP